MFEQHPFLTLVEHAQWEMIDPTNLGQQPLELKKKKCCKKFKKAKRCKKCPGAKICGATEFFS